MDFGFYDGIKLVGALGFFIYGMKIMSEGIQRAAGNKLRDVLKSMTKNQFIGVITGFIVTSVIQSSSATTVMTVSFVNAGLLNLVQSVGVIMGANIGTTVTGFIVAGLGFKVKMGVICLPIIGVGFPMLFSKRFKSWGEFLIGFAILFMGLDELKQAVPDIKQNPQIMEFVRNYSDGGFFTLLLFVLIGTILTVVIQSSSATMALTLTMCFNGWIPFHIAAAMVLGENIGTTITAQFAALIGNVHAKRTAWVHTIFNLTGVIWMLILLHPFLKFVDSVFVQNFFKQPSAFTNTESIPTALAWFHGLFNVCNVLFLIWFTPTLVKAVHKIVPSKNEDDEQYHLEYFSSGLMSSSELSILESKKEVVKFGELTHRMLKFFKKLLLNNNKKESQELIERIKKYEEITDKIEVEIVNYLLKISSNELAENTIVKVRSQLSIIRDLERVADIFYQMTKVIERKKTEKIWFHPEQRNHLVQLIDLVEEAFEVMVENLRGEVADIDFNKALEIERRINKKRDELREGNWSNVGDGDYDVKSALIYNDLFSSLEKIGDQIINVSEALVGKI